ncbi:hypothetical protein CF319_g7424 [Tilletia indica]|nr:hypothetical protein CF319_g7424 [Tilletia indica]
MSPQEFKAFFRLSQEEVDSILPVLRLPGIIKTNMGDICTNKTAFLYVHAFLGGSSLYKLEQLFGRSYASIQSIVKHAMKTILNLWEHLLDTGCAHEYGLQPERLSQLSAALRSFGSPSYNIWGFLDGTIRSIARPKRGQRSFYNGWKRVHAVKYQIVTAADGLMWISGPYRGPRHDSTMLQASKLHNWLDLHSARPTGELLCLFADKGYAPRGLLMVPYKGFITDAQRRYNLAMSRVRVEVEHAIGWITRTFPRLDVKRLQQVPWSSLGREYKVAVILVNALSCLAGNQTSQRIGIDTPSLADYFVPKHDH